MTVTKFVSSAKLAEYLEQEMLDALNARGLYDISRYGWLDDDVPDPEYRGMAAWQAGDLALPDREMTARLREIGNGFVSCMRSGLHSLGLAIVFARASEEEMGIFSGEAVGFHCRDTVMKLGLAALGLRDFFVTLTRLDPGPGSRVDSATYQAPFAAALSANRGEDAEMYGRMARMAADIASRCHVCERLSRELDGDGVGVDWEGCVGGVPAGAADGAIRDLCEWYKLMIAAGNQVFLLFAAMAGRHSGAAARSAARGGR